MYRLWDLNDYSVIYQFSQSFTRKCEAKENEQKIENYKICDVKITNDGLIQSSKKIGISHQRMITVRALSEDIITKEFIIDLPELGIPKKDDNDNTEKKNEDKENEMDLYEFMEYHNGYLYVKIDDENPMRVYDVKYNFVYYKK